LKQRCELLKNKKVQFCYECSDFPCENLQKLDKRYEKKGWDVSFSDNNRRIKEIGLEKFIKEQEEKWTCPVCKGPISVHGGQCINCG
jgi:competence CoiA-like predicted nuclease